MISTDIATTVAIVLGILLIAAVIAGLRAGGATRSASQRAADAGERLATSRKRLTELEVELYEVRRQLAARPTLIADASDGAEPPIGASSASGSSVGAPAPAAPASGSGAAAEAPALAPTVGAGSGSGASVGAAAESPAPAPAAEAPEEASVDVDDAIPLEPSDITAPQADDDHDILGAVWSLERLELEVQRQRDAGIMTAPPDVADGTLVGALQREVERIREEMGTPGEMHNELPDDPEGGAGLLMLGSVRMTLGALARHCQAFDLRLGAQDGRLEATIVCEGFEADGADEASAAVDAIAAAVAAAGATAAFTPGTEGAAHAELSFPAH